MKQATTGSLLEKILDYWISASVGTFISVENVTNKDEFVKTCRWAIEEEYFSVWGFGLEFSEDYSKVKKIKR